MDFVTVLSRTAGFCVRKTAYNRSKAETRGMGVLLARRGSPHVTAMFMFGRPLLLLIGRPTVVSSDGASAAPHSPARRLEAGPGGRRGRQAAGRCTGRESGPPRNHDGEWRWHKYGTNGQANRRENGPRRK